jgi:hypothetical protein
MNKRIKKLWIKALRSGKYEQQQSALRVVEDGDVLGYCCLGVLCEVYRRSTGHGKWAHSTFSVGGAESMSQLPDPVCEWAGIEERNPKLGRIKTAITLNDQGKPFTFIADRIEKYL